MKFSGTITLQYDTPFSPFTAGEYEEGLDWLASQGFDGAEVCISNYDGIDIYKVKEDLEKKGLGCSTISTGQARGLENISLLHEGEALKKAQERMLQHVDAAAVLGSKVTLGLLRGLGSAENAQKEKEILARNLDPILAYAQDKHVIIMLEAINRYETALFNSAAETVEFIGRQLGNPKYMGILWDIFHANIEDASFDEAIDCMGNRLQHVHAADSNRMFPGYGHTNFGAIVKKLKTAGFSQYMSFECLNLPSLETVRGEAGRFIQEMRNI
ncbi:MAG: sugar phosphate isomerase/epimerase family protein [Blautia sp.]|jgi:sugar phosphate isomerase/epimerase